MNQRLIPVRCWSCNKPLQLVWDAFRRASVEGEAPEDILLRLGVKRYCCRRMLITQPLALQLPQKREEELDGMSPPPIILPAPLPNGMAGEKSEESGVREESGIMREAGVNHL